MGGGSLIDALKVLKPTMRCDKETGKDVIVWMTPEFPPCHIATATMDCLKDDGDGSIEIRMHRANKDDLVIVGDEARETLIAAIDVEDLEFQIHEAAPTVATPETTEVATGHAEECTMHSA